MDNKKKVNTASKGAKKWLHWVIAVVAVGLVVAAGIFWWIWDLSGDTYTGPEPVRVNIPANTTTDAIGDSLRNALGDKLGAKVLRLWTLQKGSTGRAHGSYLVKPGDKAINISRALLHGLQTPVKVTFNNTRTMDQLAQKVAAHMELTPQQFLEACDSILPTAGFKTPEFPAAFLPDTYEFYWSASPSAVVNKLLGARNAFWNDDRRAKAKALGLTPVKVASLAAIVEEETAKRDERPKVAQLYINRLNKGMLLQADPTVKYAVGDFGLRRITNAHLQVQSPYNTYKNKGLTPGPIRIAEKSALDAVLNPSKHNYLYMCAKEDFSGYHNFAVDYSTHLANARRYQAELNRRGIK